MNSGFRTVRQRLVAGLLAASVLVLHANSSHAFGDLGHEIVALVARANLTPRAVEAVDRLLKLDAGPFRMRDGGSTADSFERQATWADYYRDSQRGPGVTPERIHSYFWHFADIEIHGGSLEAACYRFPQLPDGVLASNGPDPDCVVNKIEQFSAELASASVPPDERLLALKYLLHFVADLHQPLHASDDMDRGGNGKLAQLPGGPAMPLHAHWDTTFVEMIGATPGNRTTDPRVAVAALRSPGAIEKAQWLSTPQPRVWAAESHALAKSLAYGALPGPDILNAKPVYGLDASYVRKAATAVSDQLAKAGYRLAAILNAAFDPR